MSITNGNHYYKGHEEEDQQQQQQEGKNKPHFILVPLMAQGHMIPMVDIARLLADRGALVSFITTPVNAARIKPVMDRFKAAGKPVRVVELEFPCAKVGLPEGCENLDLIASMDRYRLFFNAIRTLQEPLELYLRQVQPVASCIISDYCVAFTAEISRRMNIPRIIFHGPPCFYMHCIYSINKLKVYDGAGQFDPVVVPDLPRRIETTKAQSPGWFSAGPDWEDVAKETSEAEASSDGIILNTFYELESEICRRYESTMGKKVWPIGPLCLYDKDVDCKATRGKKSSVDEHQVLSWLDSKDPKSVIYVSFGSLTLTKPSQLIEVGYGLEASNCPFIWVIKEAENCPEIEEWMSEGGFEERTKERGLIIIGWAPQAVILPHPSVGGFMTHCGWNSTLEAICAGLPMATWPHFADQFLNEKLVVEILEIGVAVGVKMPTYMITEEEVAAKREEVEKAVLSLMDGGEEAVGRRERAAKFGEEARKAVDQGGSSYKNLTLFMDHILHFAK